MMNVTKTLGAATVGLALSFGTLVPVQAQEQEGLVNVNVSDVDLGVIANVQVPIAIAANVCGVAVNALTKDVAPGETACDADADTVAQNKQFMRFAERQGHAGDIEDAAS